ncbi:MAG: undecaprenyldiphospho-muramoylpentapeptide beta-N-acetylglucosaminyltransferase [Desulfobulbaceae bacterium]|nr:MAG: undecaprenyldiphospho-muramoylpentapeptide beta-N-acetylglucosaminyltransferase [Desulfobulbaceae bacterium]
MKGSRPVRLLLTGGGTGGHLFPAIAAAEAFQAGYPGTEVLFVGTRRKMDAVSLGSYGFTSCSVHCYGLKGKNPAELLKALAVLPVSLVQAVGHIRRFRPDVVLGVGGYVTGPVVTAARLLGIPTVIHEQNSVPGLANRKLARIADRICLSLPDSGEFFPGGKTVLTGNPVRQEIADLARQERRQDAENLTVLVLGGSQGAHGLNMLVRDAFCGPGGELLRGIRLVHQTGERDEAEIRKCYRDAGLQAEVAAFIRDMPSVYRRADLLVSRAGATTLSELAILGLPAILVPYPFAADNHQEKNAGYYVRSGGAVMFRERELTAAALAAALVRISGDRAGRQRMGEAMRRAAFPDAAKAIVAVCRQVIKNGEKEQHV